MVSPRHPWVLASLFSLLIVQVLSDTADDDWSVPVSSMCPGPSNTACWWRGKPGSTMISNFSCSDGPDECAGKCCTACENTDGCMVWTWWGHDPNGTVGKSKGFRCYLVREESGKLPGPAGANFCRSGSRPPPPPPPTEPAPADAKNVVLIVVDDMRPQMNEAYGQEFMITPNLDKLARSAVVFDRAYVQMAWCSPSRNSFMTGRRPDTLQIWDFGKNFRDTPENPPTGGGNPDMSVVPMPEYFKKHGYLTLGGGKIYHPKQPPNDDAPYSWSPDIPYFTFIHQACPSPGHGPAPGNITKIGCGGCPQDQPDEMFYDWQLANHTIHSLRYAQESGKPFFIGAGFRRPHTPWYIGQRFVDMYNNSGKPFPPPKYPNWAEGQPHCAFICGGDGVGCDFSVDQPRPPAEASLCRKTYYAAITSTDHYIGLILDELDTLGLTHNTAVAVFGDHGWHLGEGNQWAKYTNLEFGTRIPLFIRASWITATPGHTRTVAELVDIFPTLAELAGLPAPPMIEGTSLVPALKDLNTTVGRQSASSQFAHCCSKSSWPVNASSNCSMCGASPSSSISYMGYAVRTVGWRWVEWHAWNGTTLHPICDELSVELYPHDGDSGMSFDSPYETVNVADDPKNFAIVKMMREELTISFSKAFAHCDRDSLVH